MSTARQRGPITSKLHLHHEISVRRRSDRRLVGVALLDCDGRFRAVQALNASDVLNARSATSALLNYTAG